MLTWLSSAGRTYLRDLKHQQRITNVCVCAQTLSEAQLAKLWLLCDGDSIALHHSLPDDACNSCRRVTWAGVCGMRGKQMESRAAFCSLRLSSNREDLASMPLSDFTLE